MCGRYTIFADAAALEARFHAYVPPRLLVPSYNAAPSQGLPTILNVNPYVITVSAWGFRPEWADWRDVTPVINARAETVATKPFFQQAFQTKRCLVLADGFYEWKRTGKGKVPYRISLKTGKPFAFAGLWSLGQDAQRRPWSTFAILTTEANRLVAQIHNRMPVILQPQDEATWLNPEVSLAQAQACLKPFPAYLLRIAAVSPKVNSPVSNTPDLLQYVAHDMPMGASHGQEEAAGAGLLFPDPAPV
jgi:putative SOS response-associated peptidase YedK